MNNGIKFENEITVEINTDIDSLVNKLEKNGFILKQKYIVNDVYFVEKNSNLNDNPLDILKKCVLVRNIITDEKNIKSITYKYKEYDDKGNIIKNGKVTCDVSSLEDAKKLLLCLGYNELLSINDNISIYANDVDEFAVQEVNNKHVYIEIEQDCEFSDKKYSDIGDMINSFNKYSIPIKDNNYFAKKAVIEFNEKYNN